MLDASGHDDNCSYAADPRHACDCGGLKKKPVRPSFATANSDSALAAMAGLMPVTEPQTIGMQLHANKSAAIIIAADETFGAGAWAITDIQGRIGPGRVEILSFKGRDFVEIYPVEFESAREGNSFKITAVQRWKRLGDL